MQTPMGVKRFTELFTGLCEVFDKKYSEVLMDVYHESLKEFEFKQVEAAFNKIIITNRFFPKPAEFIEAVTGGSDELNDAAIIQADRVVKAISSVGGYNSICFDDPVTNAVIQNSFGGWEKLCFDTVVGDHKWIRKDFVKAYTAYMRQGIKQFDHLPGYTERVNSANGYDLDKPVLIGNPKQVERIEHKNNVIELARSIGNV